VIQQRRVIVLFLGFFMRESWSPSRPVACPPRIFVQLAFLFLICYLIGLFVQ
jgi:hypothetical protein